MPDGTLLLCNVPSGVTLRVSAMLGASPVVAAVSTNDATQRLLTVILRER